MNKADNFENADVRRRVVSGSSDQQDRKSVGDNEDQDSIECAEIPEKLENDKLVVKKSNESSTKINLSDEKNEEEEVVENIDLNADDSERDFGCIGHNVVEHTEEFVRNIWNVCSFQALPKFLQDNDYLHHRHRPELNSFIECCKSIFRWHTETVNIWTHLLGCILFMLIYVDVLITKHYTWQDKLVYAVYFIGTVICLGLSTAFHVLHCHSEYIGRLFNKLDYCGIAVLIMVSFVPWLYYCFYCDIVPIVIYLSAVFMLGSASIVMSFYEKFSYPNLRPLRTGVFITFGLSGVVPAMHYLYLEGSVNNVALASVGWLTLMGALYIIGAMIYALRIPERLFPGKCDILFQSHQIFHVFVLAAAFIHYYGITKMTTYRTTIGNCTQKIP